MAHLLTFGLGLVVLARLEPATLHDPLTWGAWLAAGGLAAITLGGMRPERLLAPVVLLAATGAACAWFAPAFQTWHLVWIGALALATRAVRRRWLPAATSGSLAGEVLRWFGLGAVGLGLFHPYLSPSLVGGGDAQGYALQLADFLTQLRAGVCPVMVGRTAYAFNGDIHPLRTAPGFLYAGGLLDLLTLRSLSAVAVQNLLLALAGFATAFGAYLSLSRLVPGHGWTTWLLAVLFVTSPGTLAPLFSGDMVATWLALPWLPWLLVALARMADRPADFGPPLHAAILLAALWWFHAPIGFWSSLCAAPFALRFLSAERPRPRRLLAAVGVAGVFLLLSGYVFASVLTLDLPADPNLRTAIEHGAIRASLERTWSGFLRPVSPGAVALLSDLQPGPGLWLALVVGLLGLLKAGVRWSARLHAAAAIGLLALLLPASDLLWRQLPDLLLTTTEKWPAQRFAPILSALAVFLALPVLASLRATHRRLARDLTILLAAGCAWGLLESAKFVERGHHITHSAERTRQLLIPGNAPLSRYAHEYYGRLPRYFSHGPADPASQLRLLDRDSLEPVLTNATALAGTRLPASGTACRFEATDYGGVYRPRLPVAPGSRHLLVFDFQGLRPEGVIQITGRHINREYRLPDSGEERAFGAGPGRDPTLTLWHGGDEPDEVEIRFVRTPVSERVSAPGLIVHAFAGFPAPLEPRQVFPLHVGVNTPAAAWLETPRLHVPGYQALVDGREVPVAPSPDGLLMLPVPAGRSEVRLFYPGPVTLRMAFVLSVAGWALLAVAVLHRVWPRWPLPDFAGAGFLAPLGRIALAGGAVALVGLGVLRLAGPGESQRRVEPGQALELGVSFPYGRPAGTVETLLTLTMDGQTVELVADYLDGKNAKLGYRMEGGAPVFSPPFPINYLARQHITIGAPAAAGGIRPVRINHRLVLTLPAGSAGS